MRGMTTSSALTRSASAAAIALALFAAPVAAAEDASEDAVEETAEDGAADDGAAEAEDEDEGGRIQMAETPRDRVGLFMLGALGLMTLAGGVTAARQLGGKRPQADGEFRWR
jgi:hypothetical protein